MRRSQSPNRPPPNPFESLIGGDFPMTATTTSTDLARWIGKTETVDDAVTATPYAALAATLDRAAERPPVGTSLPPLWHWLYFLPLYRQSEVGPDGHAKRGGFQIGRASCRERV